MCFATPGSSCVSSGQARSCAAASLSCRGVVRRFSPASRRHAADGCSLIADRVPASPQDCLGGCFENQPPVIAEESIECACALSSPCSPPPLRQPPAASA